MEWCILSEYVHWSCCGLPYLSRPATQADEDQCCISFDDIPVGSYLLDEDKYNELYQTVNKSGEIVDTSKHYGLIMNIALAGSYTGFNGDINEFESQYPVFDNAIMYVKSIDISSENI